MPDTEHKRHFLRGIKSAEEKGRAAAEDPISDERDNPYRYFEHRICWRDGFRERRAELAREGETTKTRRT